MDNFSEEKTDRNKFHTSNFPRRNELEIFLGNVSRKKQERKVFGGNFSRENENDICCGGGDFLRKNEKN